MHLHCCHGVCKSDSRRPQAGVTFMPFPKPFRKPKIAKRWVYLCARNNFTVKTINRFTYICSKHFPPGEVLNLKANPALEPFNARKQYKKVKERKRKRAIQSAVELDLNFNALRDPPVENDFMMQEVQTPDNVSHYPVVKI